MHCKMKVTSKNKFSNSINKSIIPGKGKILEKKAACFRRIPNSLSTSCSSPYTMTARYLPVSKIMSNIKKKLYNLIKDMNVFGVNFI